MAKLTINKFTKVSTDKELVNSLLENGFVWINNRYELTIKYKVLVVHDNLLFEIQNLTVNRRTEYSSNFENTDTLSQKVSDIINELRSS